MKTKDTSFDPSIRITATGYFLKPWPPLELLCWAPRSPPTPLKARNLPFAIAPAGSPVRRRAASVK